LPLSLFLLLLLPPQVAADQHCSRFSFRCSHRWSLLSLLLPLLLPPHVAIAAACRCYRSSFRYFCCCLSLSLLLPLFPWLIDIVAPSS
jgi:hypothetical protein